jgi:hypothetical protein
MVSPSILNGSNSSQIKGNNNNKISARGQLMASNMNHSIIAINIFIKSSFG